MLKYQKVILIVFGLSLLSVVDTIKGFIISELGYTMEFWLVESVSLLLSVFYYIIYGTIFMTDTVTLKKIIVKIKIKNEIYLRLRKQNNKDTW